MNPLNETHDPDLRSWVASAQLPSTDFPIQNLPFATFRRHQTDDAWRGGVAIGDQIVDLAALARSRLPRGQASEAIEAGAQADLNALLALGQGAWSTLRRELSRALRQGSRLQEVLHTCLVPQEHAEFALPVRIGDYTDFYTSIYHATNIGKQFRPDHPLLPNYKWVPIGYHGRASSIVISGHTFARPWGQVMPAGATQPELSPSQRMDVELEVGIFIGTGNRLGEPITIDEADSHVFGLGLLNDWSARDLQSWEYQPLGPFLAKNFATTISPWIVTLEALAPYRMPSIRPYDDPDPLPYLDSRRNREAGHFDIQLEVALQTRTMRAACEPASRICHTSYRHAYWTVAQLVTHHTVNGCNLHPGDLLGSGTLSGPTLDQAGALIELTVGGKQPLRLPNGETRAYLEDGDCVTIRGWCERSGAARIGFGSCVGTIEAARPYPGH